MDMIYGVSPGRSVADIFCKSESIIIPYGNQQNNWSQTSGFCEKLFESLDITLKDLKEDLNFRIVSQDSFLFKFVSSRAHNFLVNICFLFQEISIPLISQLLEFTREVDTYESVGQ